MTPIARLCSKRRQHNRDLRRMYGRRGIQHLRSSDVHARRWKDESQQPDWLDHLGREFDFYLEHFPEEPGPREIILPHNPLITREMDIQVGDILIGRPLGMSCGCPITHCGVAMRSTSHGRNRVVRDRPAGPPAKGLQGPGLLHCRGVRGIGQRNPMRTKDRHAILLPAADVHVTMAAQRTDELSQPQRRPLSGAAGRAVDRVKIGFRVQDSGFSKLIVQVNVFTLFRARFDMRIQLKQQSVLPGFGLTMGFTLLYLSLIVLIPLAGLFLQVGHDKLVGILEHGHRSPGGGLVSLDLWGVV